MEQIQKVGTWVWLCFPSIIHKRLRPCFSTTTTSTFDTLCTFCWHAKYNDKTGELYRNKMWAIGRQSGFFVWLVVLTAELHSFLCAWSDRYVSAAEHSEALKATAIPTAHLFPRVTSTAEELTQRSKVRQADSAGQERSWIRHSYRRKTKTKTKTPAAEPAGVLSRAELTGTFSTNTILWCCGALQGQSGVKCLAQRHQVWGFKQIQTGHLVLIACNKQPKAKYVSLYMNFSRM